jgi:hypothetical protein
VTNSFDAVYSMTPLSAIRIGARVRHDFGDIGGLARSIEQHGLLHPVVITEAGELIAGQTA